MIYFASLVGIYRKINDLMKKNFANTEFFFQKLFFSMVIQILKGFEQKLRKTL